MGGDACVTGSWPSACVAAPRVKPPANVAPLFRRSRRLKRFEPIGLSLADEPTRKSAYPKSKVYARSGPFELVRSARRVGRMICATDDGGGASIFVLQRADAAAEWPDIQEDTHMCRRRLMAPVVLAVLGVFLLPAAASAQSAIAGTVRDTTGAVLPGVTIEAASPVLIER